MAPRRALHRTPHRTPRRNREEANPDPNLMTNAINQALTAMLPAIIEAVRNSNQDPNMNHGANGINLWLKEFQKQKPKSFITAATPIEAKDWISHIEKIFRVLGVEDQYKSRLASYKLEEDAHNWWESVLEENGGDEFVENLPWTGFRSLFFEKYFTNVDKGAYKREYHTIRQRNNEPLSEFTERFCKLVGSLGAAAGPPEEQAEKYQWALCDDIRGAIIHSTFYTVSQAASAAKKVDMERKARSENPEGSRNRSREDDHVQSISQTDQHQVNNYDPSKAQPQRPQCNTCGKFHGGVCLKATGNCYRCREAGHTIRDCPKPKGYVVGKDVGPATRANVVPPTNGGRVFALTANNTHKEQEKDVWGMKF